MFDRSVYRLMYTIERSGRGRQVRHLMSSRVLEPSTIGSYRYGGGCAAAAEEKNRSNHGDSFVIGSLKM